MCQQKQSCRGGELTHLGEEKRTYAVKKFARIRVSLSCKGFSQSSSVTSLSPSSSSSSSSSFTATTIGSVPPRRLSSLFVAAASNAFLHLEWNEQQETWRWWCLLLFLSQNKPIGSILVLCGEDDSELNATCWWWHPFASKALFFFSSADPCGSFTAKGPTTASGRRRTECIVAVSSSLFSELLAHCLAGRNASKRTLNPKPRASYL